MSSCDDDGLGIKAIGLGGKLMDQKKASGILLASTETSGLDEGLGPTPAHEKSIPSPNYEWLGPSLRRIYDDVLNEPIPESFIELLKQLYNREKRG